VAKGATEEKKKVTLNKGRERRIQRKKVSKPRFKVGGKGQTVWGTNGSSYLKQLGSQTRREKES